MQLLIKYFSRTVIFLAILVVVLMVAEVIVNHHDSAKSFWTRPDSIQEPGGVAPQGLRVLEFNDIRFRTRDMRLYIVTKRISSQEAPVIPESVRGSITMTLNGKDFSKFDFKLKESQIFNFADGKVTRSGLFDDDEKTARLEFDKRVDRDFLLVPASPDDEADYLKFSEQAFGIRDKLLLNITLDGPVPHTATFMFVYRRSAKSVLNGTFLEPLGNWALSLFKNNIFGN